MTAKQHISIVFLFDDEVRLAAKAVAAFMVAAQNKDTPDKELSALGYQALRASAAALSGAEDDSMAIMLASRKSLQPKRSRRASGGREG